MAPFKVEVNVTAVYLETLAERLFKFKEELLKAGFTQEEMMYLVAEAVPLGLE